MPKILITRKLPAAAEAEFLKHGECLFNASDKPMTGSRVAALAVGCDAIACTSMEKYDAETLAQFPDSVKLLATVSAGYEHIDLNAAKARGITVSNAPDVLTDATADVTLLLMLGAARGASWGDRTVRDNKWPAGSLVNNLWHDVSGRRLGIFGMGRIGQAVAQRARGFNMAIHYHNRSPVSAALAHNAVYHDRLEDMLPHCDFLAINCAMSPETKNRINATTIALLPKGAVVVNAARGGIVEDAALIAALQSGHVAAAGLDVFANEPNIDPRYRNLQNVFLLPHIGSATHQTRANMGLRALANIVDFFAGQRPRDVLN
jgi:lactate dehydrogenase-like 2-hydroxyacid dehydrogenase